MQFTLDDATSYAVRHFGHLAHAGGRQRGTRPGSRTMKAPASVHLTTRQQPAAAAHQFYDDEQGQRTRWRRAAEPAVQVDQTRGRDARADGILARSDGRVSLIYYRLVFLQRLDAFNPAAASPGFSHCPLAGRRSNTERSSRSTAHYISVNYWTSATTGLLRQAVPSDEHRLCSKHYIKSILVGMLRRHLTPHAWLASAAASL